MDTVPKEYEDCCVKVMDYLYVGDKKSAKSKLLLEKVGITDIINVTPPRNQGGVHNFFENDTIYNYLRIPCVDSDVEMLTPYFEKCIQFINNARDKGHSVLVHCQLGQSRSVTIILAYMISMNEWDLKTAYTHLKTIRPKVKPKSNFLRQLIQFQNKWNIKNEQNQDDDEEKEDEEKEDDEDDDIKHCKTKNKTHKNKKRKLEKDDDCDENVKILNESQPPTKKLKLSNGNGIKAEVEPRVFGVALPPHLSN